jgi:phosphotransferase system enzyme I (PtsI)
VDDEIHLKGAPISDGIAIGVPFFWGFGQEDDIPEFPIATGEVEGEIARYRRALFSSREELERLMTDLESEGSKEAMEIIDTHIQMLQDPLMTTHMEEKIRQMRQNTETVFRSVMQEYEKRFERVDDSFFRQRLIDVMDLSKRILSHLFPTQKKSLADIPPNSIVFAQELIPSEAASVQASRVMAFVTVAGGGRSHAALIARAKGIPFVSSVDMEHLHGADTTCVIVDGRTGEVILNPSDETLCRYRVLKERLHQHYLSLEKEAHLDAVTEDGHPIAVLANIGMLEELDVSFVLSGVGLLRSEYLAAGNRAFFFSEEEQYAAYVQVLQRMHGKPCVLRAFDIGGDKHKEWFLELSKEQNPVLGCRGIRFLLHRRELFRTQLRAALRAASCGPLHFLLPLLSDLEELRTVKHMLEEVRAELAVDVPMPLGCMIEVPSAGLTCDLLAQECDFLSIGSNDLIQYTLGVDRAHPFMDDAQSPAHPSIIRMIKMIVMEGKRWKKPVSLCGEIASNSLFVPLLLGLGVTQFSCAPRYISAVKRAVRKSSLAACQKLAQRVLALKTSTEVLHALRDSLQG